ncbi:MAG: MFS transporter [Nitrospirae bacterium]|nr:MFS transporter [Nitrospirota bacterium]MDE3039124.1 MFS transporter [Nitrospirota bacterium]MDE3051342.1 MFS transporter [Nitrospirota bacterium]
MRPARIPRNVWVAGWVSFFMDVSSEMVYPLVPLFLSSTFGTNKSIIGLIEGIAEASASVLKLFSGVLADRFGRHKLLMGLGYGISTLSRPALALAAGWGLVLASRFVDRVGKGIRTAPRDAIIAASTPSARLGAAFGLHRAMDAAGAVVGPAVAILILALWETNYRLVFWLSILPGIVAVLLIAFYITPDNREQKIGETVSWSLRGFNRPFVQFLVVIGLFSLGNSSNAFLILKAQQGGMTPAWISVVYLVFNVAYALLSIPGGMLGDRFGRPWVIVWGFSLFALVYAGFALADNPWPIAVLFVLYGCYMGVTDGVQRAYLATLVSKQQMATGFGLYHMVVGLAILPASVVAGFLWDHISPSAPFWFGAGMAALAMLLFVTFSWQDLQASRIKPGSA